MSAVGRKAPSRTRTRDSRDSVREKNRRATYIQHAVVMFDEEVDDLANGVIQL